MNIVKYLKGIIMSCYNFVDNFLQLQDIDLCYKELKNRVLSEASSKIPTIIRYEEKNQLWLFLLAPSVGGLLAGLSCRCCCCCGECKTKAKKAKK